MQCDHNSMKCIYPFRLLSKDPFEGLIWVRTGKSAMQHLMLIHTGYLAASPQEGENGDGGYDCDAVA